MQLSVIICTHNPRKIYLERVMNALESQTLPKDQWELLLIDNASKQALAASWNLTWHPNARHIREDEVGLTPARLRGINESNGDLLIFVDDDNILKSDYLEKSVAVSESFPHLGAFGAANVLPEFEVTPSKEVEPYLPGLVICESETDHWSNIIDWSSARPHGAGLCVRRAVALDYLSKVSNNPIRKMLGRSGVSLGAGEDVDLAWCAIDIGFGVGRFAALTLTHLIPKERLTEDYMVKLYSGFATARQVLNFLRPKELKSPKPGRLAMVKFAKTYLFANPMQRKIMLSSFQAERKIRQLLASAA